MIREDRNINPSPGPIRMWIGYRMLFAKSENCQPGECQWREKENPARNAVWPLRSVTLQHDSIVTRLSKSAGRRPDKGTTLNLMADTGLNGPFTMGKSEIDAAVTQQSPGAYALDQSHDSGPFHITYVGRSDTDVNARLQEHVGKYKRFKFEYYTSAQEAYEKECALYHDFNPPARIAHPARPAGTDWKCPRCNSRETARPH